MKTLTARQIETLKKLDWVETLNRENNSYFMSFNLADQDFLDLTGVDLEELYDNIYLPVSNRIEYYKSSVYKNGEKFFLQYIIFIDGVEWARSNFAIFVGDILELYTPKEEPTEEKTEEKTDDENFIDYLQGFVGERPDGDVIELIKQNLTTFWNNIVTDVMENAEEYDLPDNLKEDVGRAWAEDNTDDIKEIFLSNATSDDLKDIATEIINDYL